MKRVFSFIFVIVLGVVMISSNAYASFDCSEKADIRIVLYPDGSRLEISTTESQSFRSNFKSGAKTYTYRNSAGIIAWVATLSASFSYDGNSSTCTAASVSTSISDNSFYIVSQSATKSSNTATAFVTIGQTYLGIPISQNTYTITLSCDKNGNLS